MLANCLLQHFQQKTVVKLIQPQLSHLMEKSMWLTYKSDD